MEIKKHKSKSIEGKRHSFFLMGILASLSVILMAFEWTNTDIYYSPPFLSEVLLEDDKIIDYKVIVKPKPKTTVKQKQVSDIIEIVEKDEKDLDTTIKLTAEIDSSIFDPDVKDDTANDEWTEPVVIIKKPVDWAEKMPEYPGGIKELYKHLGEQIKFTECARRNGISGKVFVQFVIEKDGSITDIEILKGLGCGLDENAINAIKTMENWKPGRQGTENVRIRMKLPIRYKLRN